jgi:hypothetical protein
MSSSLGIFDEVRDLVKDDMVDVASEKKRKRSCGIGRRKKSWTRKYTFVQRSDSHKSNLHERLKSGEQKRLDAD